MTQTSSPLDAEPAPLRALRHAEIVDGAPEPAFDRILDLARAAFDVPIAAMSLVDTGRHWIKARAGLALDPALRATPFCQLAIAQDAVLTVPDAAADPRFAAHPLVTGPLGIRFYAGTPIRGPEGDRLGTVCLLSDTPRAISADDCQRLRAVAGIASNELELRVQLRTSRRLAEERRFLLEEVDHRLDLVAHILRDQAMAQATPDLRRALRAAADRVVSVALLNRDLRDPGTQSRTGADYVLSLCGDLQDALVDGIDGRSLDVHVEPGFELAPAQRPRLGIILTELVTNAVKHGQGAIHLSVARSSQEVVITVRDDGPGFGARFSRDDPAWGDGLRLVAALCGQSLVVDPADRRRLIVSMPAIPGGPGTPDHQAP
jgi:two-component sensor histidine kinase